MKDIENVNPEIQLYAIRWWIVILIAIDSVVLRIVKNSFGLVNNVFKNYFEVGYLAVDWFTLIQIPGIFLSSLVLTPIIFYKLLSLRKLSIAMGGSLAFVCICLLVAYIYPMLFPFIFIGEFIVGFVVVAMDTVSASFAISWFPEHQVGLALSIKMISGNTGSLLAYLIPSNLLVPPPTNLTTFLGNETDWKETVRHSDWFKQIHIRLIVYTLVLFTISFAVLLFLIGFFSDRPPKPPTLAQASVCLAQKDKSKTENVDIIGNLKEFYRESIQIMRNKLVLQVAVIFSITQGCNLIQKLFMGEILRKVFIELGHVNNANVMSGYVLVLFEFGCIVGSVVSGKVVDNYKNYRVQVILGLLFCFISMIGILIGYYFVNLIVIYIANTSYGFFITFLVTPIFETVYQHMYPIDTGFLTLILRIQCSFATILIGQISRLWLNLFGGISVLSLAAVFLFVALIISLFLKPKYSRLDGDLSITSKLVKSDSEKSLLFNSKSKN